MTRNMVWCTALAAGSCLPVAAEEPKLDPTLNSDPAQYHRPDIFSVIPVDATTVLIIHDLAGADKNVAQWSRHNGDSIRPLYMLKSFLEMPVGLDAQGSAAIFLRPGNGTDIPAKRAVLVLPVLDRSALFTFLQPTALEPGVDKLIVRGSATYARESDGYVWLAPGLELLQPRTGGMIPFKLRLADAALREAQENDVWLWVDRDELRRFATEKMPGAIAAQISGGVNVRVSFTDVGVEATIDVQRTHSAVPIEAPMVAFGIATVSPAAFSSGRFAFSVETSVPYETLITAPVLDWLLGALRSSDVVSPDKAEALFGAIRAFGAACGEFSLTVDQPDDSLGGLAEWSLVCAGQRGPTAVASEFKNLVRILGDGPFVNARMNRLLSQMEWINSADSLDQTKMDQLVVDSSEFDSADREQVTQLFGREGLMVRAGSVNEKYYVISSGGGRAGFDRVVAACHKTASNGNGESMRPAGQVRDDPTKLLELRVNLNHFSQLFRTTGAVAKSPTSAQSSEVAGTTLDVTLQYIRPGALRWSIVVPNGGLTQLKELLFPSTRRVDRATVAQD